jgi:uncharacterized protein
VTRPDFQELQYRFSAHLRDPEHCPPPGGVEDRRLQVYRELIFNNALGFMRKGFPVIRRTLGDEELVRLTRAWLVEYRARTPLFPRMPGEFVDWIATGPAAVTALPPWLPELAHYEWVELELSLADATLDVAVPAGSLGVSPLACVLEYDWPVHRIGPEFLPDTPAATRLLVHRDDEGHIHFHETTEMTHALLQLLAAEGPLPATQLLERLGVDAALADAATALLDDLAARGIVLWTVPASKR